MPRSDWRSPTAYAYVSDLDPSGLAWEFLRRNPEYRREYRAVSEGSQSNDQAEAFARRWGMRFCVVPDIPANKAVLIWLPRINPASVLIACVYQKPKSDRSGDEVRQGWRANQ